MKKTILTFLILFFLFYPTLCQAEPAVYIIPVKGAIDLGLSSFIRRSCLEAKENQAKAVILEIDTFGGRVDAAVEIADTMEEIKPILTVAFIDDQAWSAGALISLACAEIIMSAGSSIGSAEPREVGFGGKDELSDEKTVSAIRAKFKSLAEENNYPVNLALAMVDKDVEVKQVKVKDKIAILTAQEIEELKPQYKESEIKILKTINPKGKLLNLTAQGAKEWGLAEVILDNRPQVIRYLGLEAKPLVECKLTWSEVLVRFITHPLVSPLLLALGFLGLLFELKIPGWGISGTLGAIFLALFFWGHKLAGLANWTEIMLFVLGLVLLLLEILVIPGFGLAGISGIVLIFSGIFLALIKHPLEIPHIQLIQAFYSLGYTIIIIAVAVLLIFRFLPKSAFWQKIILHSQERKEEGFQVASLDAYLGKVGTTITILRPSGRAVFAGQILDVISQGGFIEKDKKVKVIDVQANRLMVEEEKLA